MFYVDDGLAVAKTAAEADALVDLIGSMFEIRKIGEPEDFLGIHICRDRGRAGWRAWPLAGCLHLGGAPGTWRCQRPCVRRARASRRVPLAELQCAVSLGPRLRLFRPVSRPVCGLGCGCLVWLRFALRGLAVWRVCAIAPSFVSGWLAFSSVFLCNTIC
jgi:hypothetical protein